MKYNPDSWFVRFMTKMADLMILNIVFLVSCLPVFTIGAALTGMNYVTLKMVRNEEGGIVRSYLSSFRRNFRQATVLWLGALLAAAILLLDFRAAAAIPEAGGTVRALLGLLCALLLMVLLYLFPELAKFDTGTLPAVKNAFLMAVGNLPKTLVMLVFTFGAVYVTLLNEYTLTIGVLVWLVFGFSGMALCNSSFLVKIFDRYIPGPDGEKRED